MKRNSCMLFKMKTLIDIGIEERLIQVSCFQMAPTIVIVLTISLSVYFLCVVWEWANRWLVISMEHQYWISHAHTHTVVLLATLSKGPQPHHHLKPCYSTHSLKTPDLLNTNFQSHRWNQTQLWDGWMKEWKKKKRQTQTGSSHHHSRRQKLRGGNWQHTVYRRKQREW